VGNEKQRLKTVAGTYLGSHDVLIDFRCLCT